MKILIANHQLDRLAGSELHTFDLCRGFRRAGHEVCVFTLEPGLITDQMLDEGFDVYTHRNVLELVEDPPDIIYLHHSTCEVFLGIVFAGRVPIVRGFVSRQGPSATPTNGGFLSGALFVSEEVRISISPLLPEISSMVALNVYDDAVFDLGAHIPKPIGEKPNFAVVSNHEDSTLADLLASEREKGNCSYSYFGGGIEERIPITPELLMPFDAILTLGRTAVCAAATGKPVYVADIHGSDGWISRDTYEDLQSKNFSGRFSAVKDPHVIGEQLLNTDLWPDGADLEWVANRVERDHSLSNRVRQLEDFFGKVIENAPDPVLIPDGYRGVYNFLKRAGRPVNVPANRKVKQKKPAEQNNSELRRLKSRVSELERELQDVRSSRVFGIVQAAAKLRAMIPGTRTR